MRFVVGILLFFGTFCFSTHSFADEELAYLHAKPVADPKAVSKHIVEWAEKHLPQTGTLKENRDGFVYLKVDDAYINQLYPMLGNREYTKPPYFRRADAPGAHISVFYVDERRQTGKIAEIGRQYSFKIFGLKTVPPKTGEFIVLQVEAPELEKLREKYGLSPLLKGHYFHITIAKKAQRHTRPHF